MLADMVREIVGEFQSKVDKETLLVNLQEVFKLDHKGFDVQ